jgi:hypothetical protein
MDTVSWIRRSNDLQTVTCGLCGWSRSVSTELIDNLTREMDNHRCKTVQPPVRAGRTTPVARQLIVDSHGATFTTPRYRWDYRRPGAWLPLSMRGLGLTPFEPDYRWAYLWSGAPSAKTWRGWWGTLQRTSMDAEVTAMRKTA